MLGIAVGTLYNWVEAGKGPAFFKLGGSAIRFRLSAVEAWMNKQAEESKE